MERFKGVPVWHASVAKHSADPSYLPTGLVPFVEWSALDVQRGRQLLGAILRGVGLEKNQIEEVPGKSLQWRRLANEAERSVIGPTIDKRKP